MKNKTITLLLLSLPISAGAAWCAANATAARANSRDYTVAADNAAAARMKLNAESDWAHAFERVAEVLRPSVVSIQSTKELTSPAFGQLPQGLSPFPGFGGAPNGWAPLQRMHPQLERAPRERGVGSGVIVESNGLIVTNNHVVDGATDLKVITCDGEEHAAKVVGVDPRTDLAVLKVDAEGLVAARWGDSDELKIGQWVAAFGSPFGLEQTMSSGIVSATGRSNMHITDYEDFIQTDTAINPGNSGGPLVDLEGRVIGINSAIVSRSGGNQGIGLSIPSNMAREITERLARDGRIVRGWLGVAIQDLTPQLARSFQSDGVGVLIGDVTENSPASRAGLRSGDIVEKLEGEAVRDVQHFRSAVARIAPGSTATLAILRDGKSQRIDVEIGSAPTDPEVAAASEERSGFGLQLADPTPQLESQLSLGKDVRGAVIVDVRPGSAAEDAGLAPGDVIVEVERKAVDNADQAVTELRKHASGAVLMRVEREGFARWVQISPATTR